MRKAWLAPVLLVVALVIQLTVLNRLHLPGGGVPDLVLVLLAALAMQDGPILGMVAGFGIGLCLDLAPPASQLIGQNALVFCLAGWAAGRLGRVAGKSAPRRVALVALVVIMAEVLSAGLGKALEPAQVSVAEVRHFLPYTLVYDLLLCPFVLYVVALLNSWLEGGLVGRPITGLLIPGTAAPRKDGKKQPRVHQPRLGRAAARTADGWVAVGPHRLRGAPGPARRDARLRPSGGVAGSASGLVHHSPGRPAVPVNLRFGGGRRGDGAVGNPVGFGQHWQPSRHPGLLASRGRQFRPHAGLPGGSASGYALRGTSSGPGGAARMRFGDGRRGDGAIGNPVGRALGPLSSVPVASSTPRLRLSGGKSALNGAGPTGRATPRLRLSGGKSALNGAGPTGRATPRLRLTGSKSALNRRPAPRPVPKLNFSSAPAPVARRPAAAPRFRRSPSWLRPSATAFGLVSGGVLDQSTFRAIRRQHVSPPRLRLSRGRRRSGVIGGLSRGPARTTPGRAKQPRFSYGRKSVLSFLAGRRIGGRWVASKRVGTRSGTWLIKKRTGVWR